MLLRINAIMSEAKGKAAALQQIRALSLVTELCSTYPQVVHISS